MPIKHVELIQTEEQQLRRVGRTVGKRRKFETDKLSVDFL